MTIRIAGNLVIKEVKGANGKFCVSDLQTERGLFKVRELGLDQLAELAERAFLRGVGSWTLN